jgi:NADPH:quinone reductase-like Zn-dependent oxidoreductase
VGGGRFAVRGGRHRVCRRAGGAPRTRGYGGDRGCGRRCRFDRGSTRPTRRGHGVLGIAGPSNDAWLADHGAVPVNYGDDLPARLRAAAPSGHIDALLDFFGGGYVAMAVEDLGVPRDRVDTITDFEAVERFGVLSEGGADAATAAAVAELADLVARGELEVPIAGVFALADVQDAYRELELRHTRGKLVLRP